VANDEPLPDGQYFGLAAYIAHDSDFAPDEAVERLRAAFPGREVRAMPAPRNRAVTRALGIKQFIVFLLEAPPAGSEDAGSRYRADIQRACAVVASFRGVTVFDMGQGGVAHQQWHGESGAAPDRGRT
jgi:hypothetical protein